MTERLDDIRRRLGTIDEIGEVVGALRAIAAAHSAGAQAGLDAISGYGAYVAGALGRLTAPATPLPKEGASLVLVVGAAQGFCGGYPARVAEAATTLAPPGAGRLVIGQRTVAMLGDAGEGALWTADMPASADMVPALASEVTDKLLELGAAYPGPILSISGTDRPGLPVEVGRIWPPEPGAAPVVQSAGPPTLTTLPAEALLLALLAETLFAEIARTIMLGLRIENRARLEAMARAQGNLKTRRADMVGRYRQARQEQTTTEVIELAAAASMRAGGT
ncbi:F0F1 ATP synthase subunit gamma [Aquicoccus sp. SCR17]|nr:F0F1 ATP synthase subunit gamma [Carideicomes alvinocaridis]